MDDLIDALEEAKKDTNVYDSNGNLLGSQYVTPQLGNLVDILSKYYSNNNNAAIDVNVLKEALGSNAVPQNTNKTVSFNIGDIVVNGANNSSDLAKAIVNELPNALLQELFKK